MVGKIIFILIIFNFFASILLFLHYCSIDLIPEEGGGSVELVNNGRDIIVNEQNVYDYVRKYAEYRMIKTQEKALEAIRSGVFDVLPETALDSLTAEDLRLLLNGVGDINVSVLSNYTSFNDESNESAEKLQRFKRWLWQIVERMTNLERQDLVRLTFILFSLLYVKNIQVSRELTKIFEVFGTFE